MFCFYRYTLVASDQCHGIMSQNFMFFLFNTQERTTDDSKESESFKEHLSARTQEYIEEILSPYFGGMMSFVKEAESHLERGHGDILKGQESK